MRLRRRPIVPDTENPFKGSLFRREQFAQSITSLIRKSDDGMVIFVNAPWGAGKSTFAAMWQAYLRKEKLEVISFDAYSSDYVADPFVSFSGEIITLLEKLLDKENGVEAVTRSFRNAAINFAKQAAPVLAKAAVRTATAGIVRGEELKQLGEALDGSGEDVADAVGEAVQRKIENYKEEKGALTTFRNKLAEVAKIIRTKQGFPLTIIVDELDRCRPSFALELLERIKHLFDVAGVVFILLVNRPQIETYIRCIYGNDVDAPTYLQKFGDLFVDLPHGSIQQNDRSLQTFFNNLLDEYDIDISEGNSYAAQDLAFFGEHFGITLRQAEHIVKTIAIDYAALTNNDFNWYPSTLFFAVLKIKDPAVFAGIRDRKLTFEDASKVLRIDRLHASASSEQSRSLHLIQAVLLSPDEFDKTQGPIHDLAARFKEFIPKLHVGSIICRRLDRFTFRA